MFEKFFSGIVKQSTGTINQYTQAVTWSDETVKATSNFYNNLSARIASEIGKLYFQHVRYKVSEKGMDTFVSLDKVSDIDEVLNWKPKGFENSTEFWTQVTKKLLTSRKVHILPKYDKDGNLVDLKLLDSGEKANLSECINLVSPFFINDNTSILDNTLSNISRKLKQGSVKGQMKINGIIDMDSDEFKDKAKKTIKTFQDLGSFNGLTITDDKTEIHEFNNSYSVLTQEEIDLIKSELLSSYFMSESILNGSASQQEQMFFYNSTIVPILNQLEKELTFKLISSSKRRKNAGNLYYEEILIDNQIFKFASMDNILSLIHENANSPLLRQNELRLLMGIPATEDGDFYLTNLNSKVIKNFSDLETQEESESESKTE